MIPDHDHEDVIEWANELFGRCFKKASEEGDKTVLSYSESPIRLMDEEQDLGTLGWAKEAKVVVTETGLGAKIHVTVRVDTDDPGGAALWERVTSSAVAMRATVSFNEGPTTSGCVHIMAATRVHGESGADIEFYFSPIRLAFKDRPLTIH